MGEGDQVLRCRDDRSPVVFVEALKESVLAAMSAKIRRLLAMYDYPSDQGERVVALVLEQAELLVSGDAQ